MSAALTAAAVVLGTAILTYAVRSAVAAQLDAEAARRERLRREIATITGDLGRVSDRVGRLEQHYPAAVRRTVTERAIRRMEGR